MPDKRYKVKAIILRRVDYGEFDRILTFLTDSRGKIGAMVKGARKPKSKLAGGIELFSVSNLVLIEGKGELDLVISSRLDTHYGNILSQYERMRVGYRAIELVQANTESEAGEEYFNLLKTSFEQLNDETIDERVVEVWFSLQLLAITGRQPNLKEDDKGAKLAAEKNYVFDPDNGVFVEKENGNIDARHIKAWRLLLSKTPKQLRAVSGIDKVAFETLPLLEHMLA
ncbi:MAG: DNA repair protein RecO [Candidatus Saccharimonadales bacterium]|nr:DNA repair protein RecO [Candidatus Saccharimonadales bacterium]